MKEWQDEKKKAAEENVEDAKKQELSETWAADAQDELEDWIEEQGIQLRY